ncbi:hypothetical protein [Nocardioides sp.]|uniref:hypothetical protein n=1 Tax=Nocardioides sp. TaxID=35761 RepID=UPI0027374D3E|nr:hypothetical protein [Nocardioides sp.]MDP3891088.1 hypothetical protein [Nocardioides sp.]
MSDPHVRTVSIGAPQVHEWAGKCRRVRIPCLTFQLRMQHGGYDATGWVRRFTSDQRPGPYLRAVERLPERVRNKVEGPDQPV